MTPVGSLASVSSPDGVHSTVTQVEFVDRTYTTFVPSVSGPELPGADVSWLIVRPSSGRAGSTSRERKMWSDAQTRSPFRATPGDTPETVRTFVLRRKSRRTTLPSFPSQAPHEPAMRRVCEMETSPDANCVDESPINPITASPSN